MQGRHRCWQCARNKHRTSPVLSGRNLSGHRNFSRFIRTKFYPALTLLPDLSGRNLSGHRNSSRFIRTKFHPADISSGRNFIQTPVRDRAAPTVWNSNPSTKREPLKCEYCIRAVRTVLMTSSCYPLASRLRSSKSLTLESAPPLFLRAPQLP